MSEREPGCSTCRPISPDLNPIEKAWSKLKACLRKVAARSYPALGRAITKGLQLITPEDARGYFHSCGYSLLN